MKGLEPGGLILLALGCKEVGAVLLARLLGGDPETVCLARTVAHQTVHQLDAALGSNVFRALEVEQNLQSFMHGWVVGAEEKSMSKRMIRRRA